MTEQPYSTDEALREALQRIDNLLTALNGLDASRVVHDSMNEAVRVARAALAQVEGGVKP